MKKWIAIAALLASCGSGSGAGSTPEATFASMKKAAETKDFRGLYALLDPEAQDMMLAGMVMATGFLSGMKKEVKPDLDAVLQKHSVGGMNQDPSGKSDPKSQAGDMLKNVKDRPGLFADLVGVMEKHSPEKSMNAEIIGDLTDVKIEGDRATGQLTKKDGKTTTLHFVKRNGLWYFTAGKM